MWGPRVASSNRLSARSSSTTTASSNSSGSETDPFASPRRSLSSLDSPASKRAVTRALSVSSDSSWIKKKRSGSSDDEAPAAVVKAAEKQPTVHATASEKQLSTLPLASETQRVATTVVPRDQPSSLATVAPEHQHATGVREPESQPSTVATTSETQVKSVVKTAENESLSLVTPPENQDAGVVTELESQPATFAMAFESKATSTATMASDYSMSSDDEDFDCQQPAGETIRVTVRFRPLLSREKASGQSAWSVHPQTHTITQVSFSSPSSSGIPEAPLSSRSTSSNISRRSGSRSAYAFDEVYQERHSTQAIYEGVARSIARSALDGVHGSLFAYGQTSSGKTFTMQGSSLHHSIISSTETETESDRRPLDSDGIIQLAVKDLFDEMARRQAASQSPAKFAVKVSYIEIYNETVRDLLSDAISTVVNVREHPVHGVFTDASERVVSDARGVLAALKDGEKSRAVGATNMNERSSRSHTLFRMAIESRASADYGSGLPESVRVGCLNFVDLAGSESAQRTGAQGQRQVEAGNINRSLLALSRVVHALSSSNHEASSPHIGFRDSKLTRILQPSLSGAARVLFICCVSPAIQFVEDTKSTLKFASRAKRIQIHASVNEILNTEDDGAAKAQLMVQSLQQENETLRKDLEKLRDAQELATNLKKQIQMMEMEMLIRGGESRESLTGLLSSLELRESFRNSDCTSAFMLEEDDGDEYGDDEYCGYEDHDGVRYDSEGEVQPEEERESIGDMRASFFVENLIDPNEMTDDEDDCEDYGDDHDHFNSEPPETVVEPEVCQHCEELERQIEAVKDLQTQQISQEKGDFKRLKGLEEAQQRVQQLEIDCVALQKLALETEASSQKKLRALEDQLAHANKLSQHQKQLIDAFQTQQLQTVVDPADDEERLLLAESGGVLSGDREHGPLYDRLRLLLTPPSGWGRTESATLLVALMLLSATLYVATGMRW